MRPAAFGSRAIIQPGAKLSIVVFRFPLAPKFNVGEIRGTKQFCFVRRAFADQH